MKENNNGERNGKGNEFIRKGKLKFEGEYLNGKRNRKGIKYMDYNLEFIGEYLYGYKRRGKTYNLNEKLEFQKNGMEKDMTMNEK